MEGSQAYNSMQHGYQKVFKVLLLRGRECKELVYKLWCVNETFNVTIFRDQA